MIKLEFRKGLPDDAATLTALARAREAGQLPAPVEGDPARRVTLFEVMVDPV